LKTLDIAIARAKERFGLPKTCAVLSCYEAGRDGFWLARYLESRGIENFVVDSASIEVNRRGRRVKTDGIDATKLVGMRVRSANGELGHWRVVRVPSEQDEDGRELHRELEALKDERTKHINRIKGLLAAQGLSVEVDSGFEQELRRLQRWDGTPVPPALRGSDQLTPQDQSTQLV
jgi:transposase